MITPQSVGDSIYRGAHGKSFIWYGSHARPDSSKDRGGEVQRFTYEGTWGNVFRSIRDTSTGCAGACSATRDTTVFGYDGGGWLDQMYDRRHNVRYYKDRIGRDTMIAPVYPISVWVVPDASEVEELISDFRQRSHDEFLLRAILDAGVMRFAITDVFCDLLIARGKSSLAISWLREAFRMADGIEPEWQFE